LPTHGIITNIGKAHLEGFNGIEGVIKAKTELFTFLRQTNGVAFVSKDNPLLLESSHDIRTITYGKDPSASFPGKLILSEEPYIKVQISFQSCEITVGSKLYGNYNFDNVMAAACIGCHFNVGKEDIKQGIEKYEPSNNRSQLVDTGKNTLILDAYNANPDSIRAAIHSFKGSSWPAKTLILGDMLELGKDSDEEHISILRLLEESGFTDVFLVGPVFTRVNTKREWLCFHDSDLARLWFDHHRLQGRTILIKGSRGIRMEKITETL